MKYYLVLCKFGHVGRNYYLPLRIPVIAETSKKASMVARKTGGVKRDHKDWCLAEPVEVNLDEYIYAKNVFENDIYFEKHSRQRLYLFKDRLIEEKNYSRIKGIKTNKINFNKKRSDSAILYKRKKEYIIESSIIREQNARLAKYSIKLNISMGREL